MSRYRVRLVPGGVIRRPLEVGVRLKREGAATEEAAEAACVRDWSAWIVIVDGVTQTETTPTRFQDTVDDPVTIRVELVGELCPGECIEWELRPVVDSTDVIGDDVTVTADGCEAVDIAFGHSVLARYAGFMGLLIATVDGEPFGESIVIVSGLGADCHDTRNVGTGYLYADLGVTPPGCAHTFTAGLPTTFPNSAFTLDITDGTFCTGLTDTCGSYLTGVAFNFSGGDPAAYGDFAVQPWQDFSSGDIGVRISADGSHDYTGIGFEVQLKWFDDSSDFGTSFALSAL